MGEKITDPWLGHGDRKRPQESGLPKPDSPLEEWRLVKVTRENPHLTEDEARMQAEQERLDEKQAGGKMERK